MKLFKLIIMKILDDINNLIAGREANCILQALDL